MNSELPFSLTYRAQVRHWREFAAALLGRSRNAVQWIWAICSGFTVGFSVFFVAKMADCQMGQYKEIVIVSIFMLPWLVWGILDRTYLRRQLEKTFAVDAETKIVVKTEAFEIDSRSGVKMIFQWKALQKITEGSMIFVILDNSNIPVFFVPRDAFATPDDARTFKSVVEERIVSAKTA